MTAVQTYMKAIHSLAALLDDPTLPVKDSPLLRTSKDLLDFSAALRSTDSLRRIFRIIMDNLISASTKNAVFFAEKLYTLMDKSPIATYLLGECFFANADYLKVYQLFQTNHVLYTNDNFLVLAARALLKNGQHQICESILSKQLDGSCGFEVQTNAKLRSVKLLILAKCQEAQEKKKSATTSYFESLKADPTNTEALHLLMDSYLVSLPEKEQFLNSIPFAGEDQWVKKFFFSHIRDSALDENKNTLNRDPSLHTTPQKPSSLTLAVPAGRPSSLASLLGRKNENSRNMDIESTVGKEEGLGGGKGGGPIERTGIVAEGMGAVVQNTGDNIFDTLVRKDNIDILCIKAKNCFMKYDVQSAHKFSKEVFAKDPLKLENLPVYAACLLETQDFSALYNLCYLLTENYPDHPVTYYVVGIHYFLSRSYETARKFFKKSNSLDKNFIFSWIAIGHSFAIQDESDHAMSVYRTCTRLFPGSHLPHLYIGMENLRTNSLATAQLNFQTAMDLCKTDPMVYNEIGVTFYKRRMFLEAREYFLRAYNMCAESESWVQETILCNIGHCLRKLGDHKAAIGYFEKAHMLNPRDGSILFALAFTHHISHQLTKAIRYYYRVD